jgi:hypothetical protein
MTMATQLTRDERMEALLLIGVPNGSTQRHASILDHLELQTVTAYEARSSPPA